MIFSHFYKDLIRRARSNDDFTRGLYEFRCEFCILQQYSPNAVESRVIHSRGIEATLGDWKPVHIHYPDGFQAGHCRLQRVEFLLEGRSHGSAFPVRDDSHDPLTTF